MTAVPLADLKTTMSKKEEKKERKRKHREKDEEHKKEKVEAKHHDKKKKKKKKKHGKKEAEQVDEEVVAESSEIVVDSSARKNDKEERKKIHKLKESVAAEQVSKEDKEVLNAVSESKNVSDSTGNNDKEEKDDSKEERKKARKLKRKAQQAEKDALMDKVPKVDGDGVAYSKLQIRRMMRRVKRGLPPVPTEAEERERKRLEAKERKEEEELYHQDGKEEVEKEEAEQKSDDDNVLKQEHGGEDEKEDTIDHEEGEKQKVAIASTEQPPKKKKKRSKPVPTDYVCRACQNKHSPLHWIYDCPDKVTVRGTNQVSKKLRGLNEPNDKKVFVSGLPFDTKRKDVEQMFQSCGKMVYCKLLTFEDTGRCKGQAYITFETVESAKEALKLSGTVIEQNNTKKDSKRKGKSEASSTPKKDLRLKVSKVLSRSVTKNKSK